MTPDVNLSPPRQGRAALTVIAGLLLALLASFGMVDNAAVAATPTTGPSAAAVAEDAIAARTAEHDVVAVAARKRSRVLRTARRLQRVVRVWWSAPFAPRTAPLLRRRFGRAPPLLPVI